MTETTRFVDTVSYTEADFADFHQRMMRPEGVIPESALGTLAPSDIGSMAVRIAPGEALIRGFQYKSDANKDLTIGANVSGSTRIDTIVLKLDRVANTLASFVHVGTPGAGAPTLTQVDGGTWEFPIADITVANAATSIVIGNISDRRAYSRWSATAIAAPANSSVLGINAAGVLSYYTTPTISGITLLSGTSSGQTAADGEVRVEKSSDPALTFGETGIGTPRYWRVKPSNGAFYIQQSTSANMSGATSPFTLTNTGTGTLLGGLNVGSATGAATGQVKTSAGLFTSGYTSAGTGVHIGYGSPANTGFIQAYDYAGAVYKAMNYGGLSHTFTSDGGLVVIPIATAASSVSPIYLSGVRSDGGAAFNMIRLKPVPGTGYLSGLAIDTYDSGGGGFNTNLLTFAALSGIPTFPRTVNMQGGVNIGSATGAATGEIKTSGAIKASARVESSVGFGHVHLASVSIADGSYDQFQLQVYAIRGTCLLAISANAGDYGTSKLYLIHRNASSGSYTKSVLLGTVSGAAGIDFSISSPDEANGYIRVSNSSGYTLTVSAVELPLTYAAS